MESNRVATHGGSKRQKPVGGDDGEDGEDVKRGELGCEAYGLAIEVEGEWAQGQVAA